jgi:hypothetical protein
VRIDRERIVLGAFLLAVAPVTLLLAGRISSPALGAVVVNEVMSSNRTTITDEDGNHGDWVELRNLGDDPVEVGGYYLSDDDEDPLRWRLPARPIPAGGHLLVWASGEDRAGASGELHTDFRIDRDGEPILLTAPDGRVVVDRLSPVAIPRDVSFGRHPVDPEQLCFFTDPTPGSENAQLCHDRVIVDPPTFSTPDGFHDDPFELSISAPEPGVQIFYTTDGSFPDPVGNPERTQVYREPIPIEDRSAEPNELADIRTTSPDWSGPEGPVQKGTVVRARTEHGQEAVGSFFVGADLRRSDLPVISIATDAEHLFDRPCEHRR